MQNSCAEPSSTTQKLLIIGYVWPEPRSTAAGSHMMSIIRCFLDRGWQVTFASPAVRSERSENLEALGIGCDTIALNCESFDQYAQALSPNAVMFDRFMMEEQFGWRIDKHCPNALKILDTEDLHCLRDARHQAYKQKADVTSELLNGDLAQREIAAIYRCDIALIISDYEASLLQRHFGVPAALIYHLPFMLDLDHLPTRPSFAERHDYISIGNFRHAPNWDSVLCLKQQLWPAIRKRQPNAVLHVYGSYAPPKAQALHAPKDGFLVHGWADDAMEVMSQARLCLAPLRFGAGIKGKLADAMLAGTPSITTPIGSEAMHDDQPWPGFVSDQINLLADHAVALYNHAEHWQQAQHHGDAILNTRFDGKVLASNLYEHVESIQKNLKQHRLANFTGAMLKHHHQRSTEFMAQWIEAKNKLATYIATTEQ